MGHRRRCLVKDIFFKQPLLALVPTSIFLDLQHGEAKFKNFAIDATTALHSFEYVHYSFPDLVRVCD